MFGANDLKQPYGLWVRAQKDSYEVIVSDNYMSGGRSNEDMLPPLAELGERVQALPAAPRAGRLAGAADGHLRRYHAKPARSASPNRCSATSDHDRLLIAEEDVATGTRLREYGLDGKYRGRDIGAGPVQGAGRRHGADALPDGSGYWIATDQFKDRSLFHVFDRVTLKHLGAFAGNKTANTDGVWLRPDAAMRASRRACSTRWTTTRRWRRSTGATSPRRCRCGRIAAESSGWWQRVLSCCVVPARRRGPSDSCA